jgi:M6 family metalloprotease-like protein
MNNYLIILFLLILFLIYLKTINKKKVELFTIKYKKDITNPWFPTCQLLNYSGGDTSVASRTLGDSRYNRNENRIKSVGNVTLKIIFVDFPDSPATVTTNSVYSNIQGVSQLFNELSFEKMTLVFDPVFKWYRMINESSVYNSFKDTNSYSGYISDALNLAKEDVQFSNADCVLIFSNPETTSLGIDDKVFLGNKTNGFTINGKYIANVITSSNNVNNMWLVHTLGHLLGLPDLNALYPINNNKTPFVGGYSLMGEYKNELYAPGLFLWERLVLGWVDFSQIMCVSYFMDTKSEYNTFGELVNTSSIKKHEYDIDPIECYKNTNEYNKAKLLGVVIPISDMQVLCIECRIPLGIDSNLKRSGILMYTVDSSIFSGEGPIRVIPSKNDDPLFLYSTFEVGQGLKYNDLTISVIKRTYSNNRPYGYTINIVKESI